MISNYSHGYQKGLIKGKGEAITEIIKEIKKWLDFHQKKKATFSTQGLLNHLMKKFLK